MVLSEIDRNLASELEYRADQGGIVILGTVQGGFAERLFNIGTIIRHVNLRPVTSVESFAELIGHFEPGQTAVFDIRFTNGVGARVAIEVPE